MENPANALLFTLQSRAHNRNSLVSRKVHSYAEVNIILRLIVFQ